MVDLSFSIDKVQRFDALAWQVGPLLVGDGNVISGASSLILANTRTENLYEGLLVAELPSFINRRFRADYLSTGMIMTSDCHLCAWS